MFDYIYRDWSKWDLVNQYGYCDSIKRPAEHKRCLFAGGNWFYWDKDYRNSLNRKFLMLFNNKTSLSQLEAVEKYAEVNQLENPLFAVINEQIFTDGDQKDEDLLSVYKIATPEERAILDHLMVTICGWTLGSLIDMLPLTYVSSEDK